MTKCWNLKSTDDFRCFSYSGRAKSSHLCDGWGFFIIFAFEVLYTILMSFPTITNMLCRLQWLIWAQKNIFNDFGTILRYFHHSKAILRSELSIVILRPKITKKSKKLKISKNFKFFLCSNTYLTWNVGVSQDYF